MPTLGKTKVSPSLISTGSSFLGTSSYAVTASFAMNGGGGGSGGNTQTGSIANQTILYNVTTSQDNVISGLNLTGNKWGVTVVEEWNSASIVGDEYYSSCSLLLHFSGSNSSTTFTDNSPSPITVTSNNGASISTAQSKFGGSSGLFDGTNDYLTTNTSVNLTLASENFTIEGWFYFINGTANSYGPILGNYSSWGANAVYFGKHLNGSGKMQLFVVNYSNPSALLTDPTALTNNQWIHFAIVRNGSDWTMYRDGVSVATATYSGVTSTTNFFYIGASGDGVYFNGYMDELRITKGVARYTGNFVTQSAEFSNNASVTQYATKYVGLVGGLNDTNVDYGIEKLSDSSLKLRKMTASGQPLSGSGQLSASVDRVYVNVLNYSNISVGSTLLGQAFTAVGSTSSYALSRSVVNPYEIVVAVDGAVQSFNNAYSVTSSTINFTENIPSGSLVDIRYLTTPNVNSASYAATSSYSLSGGTTSGKSIALSFILG